MAVNLAPLSSITTTATALSNLILVTPQSNVGYQPQNNFIKTGGHGGIDFTALSPVPSRPTLVFDYEGEQTVQVKSDITDHFIEDNTAIQDQVSLKPVTITTHGFIGELNDIAPEGFQLAQFAVSKLTTISAYTPELSVTAQIAYNDAFQAYQIAANAVASAVSAWATITGAQQTIIGNKGLIAGSTFTQNKQQKAFQQFFGYQQSRTFFTVQTPWAVFQNMMIESLRTIQEAETRMITDFEISFKQIRLAATASVSQRQALLFQGRLNQQAFPKTNNGAVPVVPSGTKFGARILPGG